ncbi:MAG: pyrroline-5-carboxylate reductase [Deltaproteobacteria bacterium]|nr:pyrroline-5-carboxylate reductase [Deltaproteobacteria bacterium]
MLKDKKIAIIGGGKMGSIIAQGLITHKIVPAADIIVTDIDTARLDFLRSSLKLKVSHDNVKAVKGADIIILAVKPQNMAATLKEISSSVNKSKVIISIAAGITTNFIEKLMNKGVRVVRVMPNTPALVGEGAAAVAAGSGAKANDIKLTRAIFNAVGISVEVKEKLMDAVTGLSGSGPAYFFLIIEALIDAGLKTGLSRALAKQLAAQTMLGAARLCIQSDKEPVQLREMVTSPGGTTAAGLKVMEEKNIRAIIVAAVEAATRRSKELASGK